MRCGRYSVIYCVVIRRNMILCPYSVWVAWKNRTRFFVARGWQGVCYILDEGIFYPCIGYFHMPLEFFSTQVVQWRCLVVITFVTITYLGLVDVGKNSNSFFSRYAWKPAIRTVGLSAKGPGEKLTNNITSKVPSPISIPPMGFLTVATVHYRGTVRRGEQMNQWWFRLSVCRQVYNCHYMPTRLSLCRSELK